MSTTLSVSPCLTLSLPSAHTTTLRHFAHPLSRHIPPTRILPISPISVIPSVVPSAGYHHYTIPIPIQQQASLRRRPVHQPSVRSPIMSSDDDMPLARTNGHCKCRTLILSCITETTFVDGVCPYRSLLLDAPRRSLIASTHFLLFLHYRARKKKPGRKQAGKQAKTGANISSIPQVSADKISESEDRAMDVDSDIPLKPAPLSIRNGPINDDSSLANGTGKRKSRSSAGNVNYHQSDSDDGRSVRLQLTL